MRVALSVVVAMLLMGAPDSMAQAGTGHAPLDTGLVAFFQGKWNCTGEFADGKKLVSSMKFTPDLGRHWLRVTHDDRAPNSYHAQSTWGADRGSGKFMAIIFDNSGSARRFTSSGWNGHTILFDAATFAGAPPPTARMERFIYSMESGSSFRMRYEVSVDGGATYRLGDFLDCSH